MASSSVRSNTGQAIASCSSSPPIRRAKISPPSYLDFESWREQSAALTGMAFARGVAALHRGYEGSKRLTIAA